MAQRGIALLVLDGVDHAHVFGEERAALLNRTKIVLNHLRQRSGMTTQCGSFWPRPTGAWW
jgi:hypothetical protein